MNKTIAKMGWGIFYAMLVGGVVTCTMFTTSDRDADRAEYEFKKSQLQAQIDEETRQRKEFRKKSAGRLRRDRDEAFVMCVNEIGIDPCTILSNWVEADRMRPLFEAPL